MLEVLNSHAIITVAPNFSLSTCIAVPTRFTPLGAIRFSPNGWKRRNVSLAFTTTSTSSLRNRCHIHAQFCSDFIRQSTGMLWEIVILQTDQLFLCNVLEINFWSVSRLPETNCVMALVSLLLIIFCCTRCCSCCEVSGAPQSQWYFTFSTMKASKVSHFFGLPPPGRQLVFLPRNTMSSLLKATFLLVDNLTWKRRRKK